MKIKKIIVALCALMAIFAVFTLGGCAISPYTVIWYLNSYEIDGVAYDVGFDWYDHFNPVYPDDAQIFFEQNGSFYFKDIDGAEYGGLYNFKHNKYDTTVALSFADGSKATGTCSGGYGWRHAELEINGVIYNFHDRERSFDEDYLQSYLNDVVRGVNYFADSGNYSGAHYNRYLTNAVIGKVGDSFVAVADDCTYLLDDYKFWCYAVYSEGIEPGELKEGNCIVRIGYNRLAIYYTQVKNTKDDKK